MKFSTALVAVFSGLAVASPLINTRENIEGVKAARDTLNKLAADSKADTEESLKNQGERQAKWTKRVNDEQDLIQKLLDLHAESVQSAADAPGRLANQTEKRNAKDQALADVANALTEALK